MGARFHSWWQQIKRHLRTILVVAIILIVAIALIIVGYRVDWTGFNGNNKSGKTLWDWLNLLGVLAIPVVVGLGTLWFTSQQGKVNDAENEDNQREKALQDYIDKMSELLLEKKLRDSTEEDEVRKVARARTLTTLPRLDKARKRSLLQFLKESNLIDNGKRIVDLKEVDLNNADLLIMNLIGTDLSYADLTNAVLSYAKMDNTNLVGTVFLGANLSYANLYKANMTAAFLLYASLVNTNLSFADLSGVDLIGADLSGANLTGALVSSEQLEKASSLKGATMPDGSIHP